MSPRPPGAGRADARPGTHRVSPPAPAGRFGPVTSPQGRMRPVRRPAVRIRDLATALGVEVVGDPEAVVTGVAVGSADVQPGDLFVALPGARTHGARFAADAAAAGAVAVLTDAEGAELVGAGVAVDLPVLVLADPRSRAGEVAARVYDHPSKDLTLVGVTGTNGKTTTTYFVQAALRTVHESTGVIGTVELRVGDRAIESPRTTVEAPVLQGLFALMREEGVTGCAMEVSSHGLALGRTAATEFDVVGFTNLQRDHLDFHGDMDGYFRDKARLFDPASARRGVVVVDDEWGRRLAAEARIPVETLATRPGSGEADWWVEDARIGLDGVGSTFTLRGPEGAVAAASPLPGLVNVSNAALAVVLAYRAGVPLEQAAAAVGSAAAIPGRMERVVERGGDVPLCLVDYAHTPDALTLALEAVRPITPGRLVLVLGSDGDRDRGKRPIMGEIAARLADVVVVTDENPRSEDPATIRAAILDGVRSVRPDGRDVLEVSPRVDAVAAGVALAGAGDTVMVTGKGHEPTQEIAGEFHRYNDRGAFLAAARARVVETVRGGVTVLDAAHGADQDSLRTHLRSLAERSHGRRAVAVVGPLDGMTATRHARPRVDTAEAVALDAIGRLAVRLDVERLIVVGTRMRALYTGAVQEGSFGEETEWVADVTEAGERLRATVLPGDVLLVAGAQDAGLWRLVEDLGDAEPPARSSTGDEPLERGGDR